MARSIASNVTLSSAPSSTVPVVRPGGVFPVKHASGHTLTVFADGGIYDETAGALISTHDPNLRRQ